MLLTIMLSPARGMELAGHLRGLKQRDGLGGGGDLVGFVRSVGLTYLPRISVFGSRLIHSGILPILPEERRYWIFFDSVPERNNPG
jgi:hypothetical protein